MKNPLTNRIGLFLWVMGVALILAFSACEKDDNQPEPVNEPNLPGIDYLGRGYNAFGDFAAADALKAPLIGFTDYRTETIGEKTYKVPEDADVQHMAENTFHNFAVQSAGDFMNHLQSSAGLSGNYPFFSGAILDNFQAIHYRTEEYAFVKVSNTVNRWMISLPYDASLIRPMLTEQAKADLAALPPASLFEKYGTHVLTSATIGARADYYVAALKSKTAGISLPQAAEASFKASLGLGMEPQHEDMVNTLRENAFIGLKVQGGNATCGHNLFSAGNYDTWLNSVDDELAVSNLSNPSLIPVWELCESSARRAEVQEAFQAYALQFELPPVVTDAKMSITDVLIKSGTEENPYFYQESGYTVIPVNLNENTGGDYVFLMYREGLDIEASITELSTVSGASPKAPPGWFRIDTNLNEGTGAGDPEIYLCYKKEAFSDNPVRQLRALQGEDPDLPDGFELVKNFYYGNEQDLNHGAGGVPVFLAYSRNESQP